MLKHLFFLFVPIVCMQSVVCGQSSSSGNAGTVYPKVQAKKYKILFITRKPLIARSLDSLVGNTLYVTRKGGSEAVSVEVISQLSVAREKRPVLRGMAFGALTGAALGAIFGLVGNESSGSNGFTLEPGVAAGGGAILIAPIGLLTGAVVGASSFRYTTYNFTSQSPAEKAASIAGIVLGK